MTRKIKQDKRMFDPNRWGKVAGGIPVPCRCPLCGSRQTRLTTYRDGSRSVECYGCNTVLANVDRAFRSYIRKGPGDSGLIERVG